MDVERPAGGRVDTVCIICGERSPGVHLRCPRCGGPAILEIGGMRWDVRREVPSMWRYESMLPAVRRRVSLGEGMTPIRRVGGAHVKLEGRNPTGSYADRASSVMASHIASAGGRGKVAVEYSEDFAYSMARYLTGISEVEVEVAIPDPSRVDPQEVVALVEMGARVSFGRTGMELGYANSLSVEGLKTIALEVLEKSPRVERIVVPAETGLLALSIWKGLRDAEEAGEGAELEVDAAILRGSGTPDVLSRIRGVAVHEVDPGDAVRGLVELARAGIRAKVLSAAAFALAEELGRGIAVVTASQRRPQVHRRGESALMADVARAVGEMGEASAYDLWRELRRYTLRGIYKAVEALEAEGELCARHVVRGGRKVRVYSRCADRERSRGQSTIAITLVGAPSRSRSFMGRAMNWARAYLRPARTSSRFATSSIIRTPLERSILWTSVPVSVIGPMVGVLSPHPPMLIASVATSETPLSTRYFAPSTDR